MNARPAPTFFASQCSWLHQWLFLGYLLWIDNCWLERRQFRSHLAVKVFIVSGLKFRWIPARATGYCCRERSPCRRPVFSSHFFFPFHFWNKTYLGCPPSTLNNNLIFWLCSCQPTSWNICNNVLPHTKHGALKIQNYPKIEWDVLVHACASLFRHHMRGSHCCFCCFHPPAYV